MEKGFSKPHVRSTQLVPSLAFASYTGAADSLAKPDILMVKNFDITISFYNDHHQLSRDKDFLFSLKNSPDPLSEFSENLANITCQYLSL